MKLRKLWSVGMALGSIGIFCAALASPCRAEDGAVQAVWRDRPAVGIPLVDTATAKREEQSAAARKDPASDTESNGSRHTASVSPNPEREVVPEDPRDVARRQENGCPQSSGLSPRKWVCLTLPESQEVHARLVDLEALLVAERAKKPKRLGLVLSCAVGAAIDATGAYGLVPPSCGLYYGFGFRLGK